MARQMTNIKNVKGTELVNAYFTMVRSDIAKSVAALRAKEDDIFYRSCDDLISSVFLAVASMRAYKMGSDISAPTNKHELFMETQTIFNNRIRHFIIDEKVDEK